MESPNNVLRANSTTKWLRSRHIRTSSLTYIHSPQTNSALQDADQVFHHFSHRGKLDFRGFRHIFKSMAASVPVAQLQELYECLLPGEQRMLSQQQFRDALRNGKFMRKFADILEDLRRKGSCLPTSPLSFLTQLADQLSEAKMSQDARVVFVT